MGVDAALGHDELPWMEMSFASAHRVEQDLRSAEPLLPLFSWLLLLRMSVELRCGVAVNRPRGVMLEGRGSKLARRLRLPDLADSRLGVPLQLGKCHPNTLPMRLPDPVVAAHECRHRDRLRQPAAHHLLRSRCDDGPAVRWDGT